MSVPDQSALDPEGSERHDRDFGGVGIVDDLAGAAAATASAAARRRFAVSFCCLHAGLCWPPWMRTRIRIKLRSSVDSFSDLSLSGHRPTMLMQRRLRVRLVDPDGRWCRRPSLRLFGSSRWTDHPSIIGGSPSSSALGAEELQQDRYQFYRYLSQSRPEERGWLRLTVAPHGLC